ncbi:MAG: hypothetical protein HYX41_03745 [Bdellovibrio sp.]|nr:hypothetical protein [Bdellovibrio sp.]
MEDSSKSTEGTKIDLGDDLIEKTAILSGMKVPAKVSLTDEIADGEIQLGTADSSRVAVRVEKTGTPQELLQSASILVAEGLGQDAKKVLHHILVIEPGNVAAQEALKKLQAQELESLLSSEGGPRSYLGKKKKEAPEAVDVDQIIEDLDRDLELGLDLLVEDPTGLALSPFGALFKDEKIMDDFGKRLEKDLASATPKDWIDLGIGFLEMEIYPIAARLFSGAVRRIDALSEGAGGLMLSAVSLEGLCFVLMGRPHDAVSCIQPVLRDTEIKFEEKIELYYLMGRAYESLNKFTIAREFYDQVREIDPSYRDVIYRLAQLRN